ncbi:hypothetical protein B0H14DRAFT_1509692 [Mycena olivaceomarginata]|nr:hypothetical protein B0H14DRAFT_1509692 [Mycena olivaceomarginata]
MVGGGLVVRAGAALCRPDPRRSCSGLTAPQTGEQERSRAGEPVALLCAHTYKLVSLRVFVLLRSFRLPTASCSCHLVATSFLLIPAHPSHTLTNIHAPTGAQNPPRHPLLHTTTKQRAPRRLAAAQTQLTHRLLALREPPAPARAPRCARRASGRGGGTVRVAGGAKGGGGRAREGGCGGSWANCGRWSSLWGQHGRARRAARADSGRSWMRTGWRGSHRYSSDQQAGLVHLTKILKGDLADINVVLKGGGRQGEEGGGEELRGVAVEAIGVRIVGADSSVEVSRRDTGRSDNFIRCRRIHPRVRYQLDG